MEKLENLELQLRTIREKLVRLGPAEQSTFWENCQEELALLKKLVARLDNILDDSDPIHHKIACLLFPYYWTLKNLNGIDKL
jgi:ABC-type Zn uptake system ZnuABC Zn-binding protein ZnuA